MANTAGNLEQDYSNPQSDCGQQMQLVTDQQLYHTPSSFCTSAQLLYLRCQLFTTCQTQIKSALSLLFMQPAYTALEGYSAVVGFTSQPQSLPIIFSDTDPIALSALSAIVQRCSAIDRNVVLLDRLDLAEYVGKHLVATEPSSNACASRHTFSRGIRVPEAMVDIIVSSLLQDTCRVAEFAIHSMHCLLRCLKPALVPSPFTSLNSVPYCNQSPVPVPFQRVCLLLQQHLYWIPSAQLNTLHQKHVVHKNDCRHSMMSFTCGSRNEVECVCISGFPLEILLEWYQKTLAEHLLPHTEPTSDVWNLLRNILTLHT